MFCNCDKIPNTEHLEGERTLFGLQFRGQGGTEAGAPFMGGACGTDLGKSKSGEIGARSRTSRCVPLLPLAKPYSLKVPVLPQSAPLLGTKCLNMSLCGHFALSL